MIAGERSPGKHRTGTVRLLGLVAVLAGLVALACAGAEPTATTAPVATMAPAPVATTAPDVAMDDKAMDDEVVARPTATQAAFAPQPKEVVEVAFRPAMTPELVDSILDMSVTELVATFPGQFPREYELTDIKRGGIFRQATGHDYSTWDPRKSGAGGTNTWANMVYERLYTYEQGTERDPYNPASIPMLATDWVYNADGTALTFTLREGVFWGDIDDPTAQGPEVVADDFAWLIINYKEDSAHGGNYRTVDNVEVVDKYTFTIHFSEPSYWVFPYLVGKDAVWVNPYLARAGRADRELVGPGPWLLQEAKKNIETTWVRNPNYYMTDEIGNQLPYMDGVRFITVPDSSTRLAMLRTGKTEVAMNIINTARDAQQLMKTNPEIYILSTIGTCGGFSTAINMENPAFGDVNLRRAMTLAFDNKGMGEVIYGGVTCPSDLMRWYWWTDEAPTWESDLDALYGPYHNHYDVAKAKELYAQTGLQNPEFELTFFMYYSIMADMVALFAADMAELGINISLKNQDYAGFNGALQSGSYPEMTYAWFASGYDPIGDVQVKFQSASTSNRSNINDPVVDSLSDDLLKAGDPVDQRRIVNEIRAQLNDQVYWLPGISSAVGFAMHYQPWVKGLGTGQGAGICCYYLGDITTFIWLDQ